MTLIPLQHHKLLHRTKLSFETLESLFLCLNHCPFFVQKKLTSFVSLSEIPIEPELPSTASDDSYLHQTFFKPITRYTCMQERTIKPTNRLSRKTAGESLLSNQIRTLAC